MEQKLNFPLCTSLTNSFEVSHSLWLFTETNGQLQTKETEGEMLELDGLDTFSNYSIRVAAFTRAGRGKSSKQIFCKTAEDGKIRQSYLAKVHFTSSAAGWEDGGWPGRWLVEQTAMMVYINVLVWPVYYIFLLELREEWGGKGMKFISICIGGHF